MQTDNQINNQTRWVFDVIRLFGVLLFAYLTILSFSYSANRFYQPLVIIFIALFIFFLFGIFIQTSSDYLYSRFVFGIILLGIVLRLFWAIAIPTEPFSDFLYFHQMALRLANGNEVYHKSPGYVFFLSLTYRLQPEIISGKLLNAFASSLSLILLFFCSKSFSRKEGLLAVTMYAILPSEIVMTSVLGTESIATFFGVLIFFIVTKTINDNIYRMSLILRFAAWLIMGLAFTIRSSFIFYFPALVIWQIWADYPNLRRIPKSFLITLLGIGAGLLIILTGHFLSTGRFSTKILQNQDSIPLLSGTNIKSNGQWSKEDSELFFSWPADQRNQLARREAFSRIKADPIGFILLVPRKMYNLMAINDYGNYWSLRNVELGSNLNLWIALLSQAVYVIIMLFSFLLYFLKKRLSSVEYVVLLILLLTLLPHVVLEVQGRYHHYIMPFLCLSAAYGSKQLIEVRR